MDLLTPLALIGFLALRRFCPILVGSGALTLSASVFDLALLAVAGVLLFRLLFTGFSVSARISGGIVLPLLAIGALTGLGVCKLLALLDGEVAAYAPIFVVCGMMALFAVVTRSWLTGIVLGLQCLPLGVILLPLALTVVLPMTVVWARKWENVYHRLERRIPGCPHAQKGQEKEV